MARVAAMFACFLLGFVISSASALTERKLGHHGTWMIEIFALVLGEGRGIAATKLEGMDGTDHPP
jgi:hypothetical protein